MIVPPLPWLPDSAVTAPASTKEIATCVQNWCDHWLARDKFFPAPLWERQDSAHIGQPQFQSFRQAQGLCLHLRQGGRILIASALLGQPVNPRDLRNDQDRSIIDRLVDGALEDLWSRLIKVFPEIICGDLDHRQTYHNFTLPISYEGMDNVLLLEADKPILVQMARKMSGSPRPSKASHSLNSAIAEQEVRIDAWIGKNRIALSELEKLGIGDILTLDTPIDQPLSACLNGQCKGEAALTLLPRSPKMMFQIERPANQW